MNYHILNKLSYREAVAELQTAVSKLNIYGQRDVLKRFILFSANLQYFMPGLSSHRHESYFRSLCLQQHVAHLDQSHPQALDGQKIEGLDALRKDILSPGPGIICTYHTGSYRLINRLLMQKQIPFALLVAREVLVDEELLYRRLFRQLCPQATNDNFQLIDAQEPSALLKLLRLLDKGIKLLLYVDGNTGIGDTLNRRNSCEVDFFAKKMAVRKGAGLLSYLSGYPVFPLLCKRTAKGALAFEVKQLVLPDKALPRTDFERSMVQQLYAHLEGSLYENPAEWEGWLHVHRYVKGVGNETIVLPERLLKIVQEEKLIV